MNITDIWKAKSNIGYTEYVNVVDGKTRTVEWGHLDWIGVISGFIVSTGFFAGMFYLAGKLAKVW